MSKLARERKKHWRVVKAIAKEQGIELLEPRKKYLPKHWYTLRQPVNPMTYGNPFIQGLINAFRSGAWKSNFIPNQSQIKFYSGDKWDEDELRGRSISQVWLDEELIMDGGQIIQEPLNYDKDKSN